MNVDALRIVDRWIGQPLCWACTAVRYVTWPFRPHRPLPKPRKILVIKLSEMGSSVLAYPAFEELRRRVPDAEIFILSFESFSPILYALPLTSRDRILNVSTRLPFGLALTGWRALRRLWRERIDTTIDMDFFTRFTAVIAFLVCRGNRVGFDRLTNEGQGRGRLLTHRVLYSPHIHTIAAFVALVRALFDENDGDLRHKGAVEAQSCRPPPFTPELDAVAAARAALRKEGIDRESPGRRLVLVNPNSSEIFVLRKWPLEHFAEYCRRLLAADERVDIAITGARSERAEAETLVRRVNHPRCVNFAGQTTFPQLLALYTLADLMVTNDSGPAHFASLPRLPTLVLFGPETPRLYSPLGDTARCLYAGFACSPCVSVYNAKKSPCTNNRCLQAITVDQVLEESGRMLPDLKTGT